jgi:hypothetical protein
MTQKYTEEEGGEKREREREKRARRKREESRLKYAMVRRSLDGSPTGQWSGHENKTKNQKKCHGHTPGKEKHQKNIRKGSSAGRRGRIDGTGNENLPYTRESAGVRHRAQIYA